MLQFSLTLQRLANISKKQLGVTTQVKNNESVEARADKNHKLLKSFFTQLTLNFRPQYY